MKNKFVARLVLVAAVMAVVSSLNIDGVEAFKNLSPDGITCTPCHTDGRKGEAAPKQAKSQQPAPVSRPAAKPAPGSRTESAVVSINGVMRKTTVLVDQGVTYIRARSLTDFFSIDLRWDDANKAVILESRGSTVTVHTAKSQLDMNGKAVAMKTAARLFDDGTGWRAYLPIRAFAEGLGGTVHYDPSFGIWVNIPKIVVLRH